MSVFSFDEKRKPAKPSAKQETANLSKEEQYGKAWRMIVGQTQKDEGLKLMGQLEKQDFAEASVVLGMFSAEPEERKQHVERAADLGNVEGIWQYSTFIPHSFCPKLENENDSEWVDTVQEAAEHGSVDAMNEMGNICHRWGNYAESMYWYAMALYHGYPNGIISVKGVAQKWLQAGASAEFVEGTDTFDDARFHCALACLEMHADVDPTVSMDDLIKYNLDGQPLAAYIAADIFEKVGQDEMVYKMYNAIAFENDPHGLKRYADMLATGKGRQKDADSSLKYYKKAAKLGERDAMLIMGQHEEDKNKNLAAYWYGLAHSRGQSDALMHLIDLA